MFFLPYRIDSRARGVPLFTLAVMVVCCLVYFKQYQKDAAYERAIDEYCGHQVSDPARRLMMHLYGDAGVYTCFELFNGIRQSGDADAALRDIARQAPPLGIYSNPEDEQAYIYNRLDEAWHSYDIRVPYSLTESLVYDPRSLDPWAMITSSLSHGDMMHLAGNLLFFFIFAASVELILGHLAFMVFLLVSMFATSLAYSYAMADVLDAMPTLGLSGVVMAAVAALGVMLPMARIRCFLWVIVIFRVVRIPALLIAAWYVGWDIFDMVHSGDYAPVNYVAHVSGAALGGLVGLGYVLFKRDRIERVAEHY